MKKDMWIKELRLWKWKLVLEKWRSYLVSCTARPVSSRKEGRVASPGHRRRAHRGQTPSGLFRPLGKGTGHCHCAKCAVTTAGWEEGFGCGLAPSGCWKNEVSFPLLQDDWTEMTQLQQWELPSVCRCADVLLVGPRVAQKSDLTSRAECSIWVTYPFLIQEIPKCLTHVFILKSKIVKFLIG